MIFTKHLRRSLGLGLSAVLLFSGTAFAKEMPKKTEKSSAYEVIYLFKETPLKHLDSLSFHAQTLSKDEKYLVYSKMEKNPSTAIVMNLLFGFGVGSFELGDTAAGNIQLIGELISLAIIALGGSILRSQSSSRSPTVTIDIVTPIGALLLFIFRIGGAISSIGYAGNYNYKLKSVLDIAEKPVVRPYFREKEDIPLGKVPEYGIYYSTQF